VAEINRNLWDRAANAWRRLVDTATVAWDTSTPGEVSASVPNLGIGTAQLANDSVTYAKLQNISAQFRALGRNSSGAGDAEEVTLSQLLDWIGSAAQGDILYRGAATWARLAAGTAGQFLQTQGAGANPQWADNNSPLTLIAFGAISSAASLIVPLDGDTWDEVKITLIDIVPAIDNVSLQLQFDQGAGTLTGASDYQYGFVRGATAVTDSAHTAIVLSAALGSSTNERFTAKLSIYRPSDADLIKVAHWQGGARLQDAVAYAIHGWGELILNDDAITDAVFSMSSGNIASGYYYAVGKKYA
jgi:hypothetical protein